jgi:signal transduction protein with GAF and PtsI domain
VFDSIEQYELESNNFLHRFADLIADFRSYESKPAKVSTYSISDEHDMVERKSRVFKILSSLQKYNNLNDKLHFIVESVVKYFDAKFARIWLVDKERKYLILKFSAGKYKNIQGEFSKVPLDSNKIGPIVKTKKPTISNDVVNDPRIRYPEWAKREGLKSFAGYPLMSKGQPIGVLGMFSEKKLSPADFEILRVFCDQISNELASFFNAAEFLSIK